MIHRIGLRISSISASSGNLLIDSSNNLIVLGDLDMSGNDIINTASISNTDGRIKINGTEHVLDATTIDLQNTSTTTSLANHNADIKTTSNGLSTTNYLKVKLNGNFIWIPYFTTDPSA